MQTKVLPDTVYGCLNANAEAWPPYRGDRPAQRRTIRDDVRTLRSALECGGFVHLGRGGSTFFYSANAKVQGYRGLDDPFIHAAVSILGIPCVDTTTVPDDALGDLIRLPIPTVESAGADRFCCSLGRCIGSAPCARDHAGESLGSLDTAPPSYLFPRWRALGATLYNAPA